MRHRILRFTLCFAVAVTAGSVYAQDPAIAYVGPLSGVMAFKGIQERRGFELAVSEQRGKGQRVNTIILDDSCSAALSAEKLRQAVQTNRALVVVGASCLAPSVAESVMQGTAGALLSTGPSLTDGPSADSSRVLVLGPPLSLAKKMAAEVAGTSKQRVGVGAGCFLHYRVDWTVKDAPDAAICPLLLADDRAWKSLASAYRAAYREEPDADALVGYSAAQVALQSLQRSRGDHARLLSELRAGKFQTPFGETRPDLPNPLGAVLTLMPNPGAERSRTVNLEALASKKTCDKCNKGGECPQSSVSDLIFVAKEKDCCSKGSECPQGSLLKLR